MDHLSCFLRNTTVISVKFFSNYQKYKEKFMEEETKEVNKGPRWHSGRRVWGEGCEVAMGFLDIMGNDSKVVLADPTNESRYRKKIKN